MTLNQSRDRLSTQSETGADWRILLRDREILRRLAGRVAELAARPIEEEKRALWYQHNALRPTRPLVFCDPENGWGEIVTADSLQCEGELARRWEMTLRKEVFWGGEMGDDRYVFSMKPSPTDLAMPVFDEERIRREVRRALQQTRDCHVEVIMKDNHTVGGDPRRVVRWVQVVREEVEAL